MTQSPIRPKAMHYPKDFLPPCTNNSAPSKKFTVNQGYQIEVSSIRKYQKNIDEPQAGSNTLSKSIVHAINPEKSRIIEKEIEEDSPLGQHMKARRPDLDEDLLKKPRFSLNDKEEIQETEDSNLQNSMSPGCIRKQFQNRQTPLPAEDPCRIELLRNHSTSSKHPNTYVKFRSTGEFNSKKWLSSEKEIIHSFRQSQSRVKELPTLGKRSQVSEMSFAAAKQQYDGFRKRQENMGNSFGKVNTLLSAMKKKEDRHDQSELPHFDKSAVDRLKEEINSVVRHKKGIKKRQESSQSQSEKSPGIIPTHKNPPKGRKVHFPSKNQDSRPQLLISYRSSLSYLKDLHSKSINLEAYHLVVKIPKLFIEKLIFKGQDKEDLYETAISMFQELRIPHENMVIKKYTNCTMLIARNVCMIWHFDGRRYLGGWQTQYLDQGSKHGLGLEWQPKKYVYYGEYIRNKKHGLGVYKDRNGVNYIGYWNKGQRVQDYEDNNASYGQQHDYFDEGESEGDYSQEDNYQYL